MKTILCTAGISATVFLASCVTTPIAVPECEILDYGIINGIPESRVLRDLDDGSNRKLGTVTGETVIQETTSVIPAKLGHSFGILHRFSGAPGNTKIKLVTTHPAISYDGVVSSVNTRYKSITDNASIFSFDLPEELAPGKWSFVFSFADAELCRQEFDVVELP